MKSVFDVVVPLIGGRSLLFNSLTVEVKRLSPEETVSWQAEMRSTPPMACAPDSLTSDGTAMRRAPEVERYLDIRLKENEKNSRLRLTIMPTTSCNFSCPYCFQGISKAKQFLRSDVIEATNRYLDSVLPKYDALEFHWYGGEPLLALPIIDQFSEKALEMTQAFGKDFFATITTNGYLLEAVVADMLHHKCHVRQIQVTLDGPASYHNQWRNAGPRQDSYGTILDNISYIADTYPETLVVIRVNVSRHNSGVLPDLLADLASRGFSEDRGIVVHFSPIVKTTIQCQADDDMIMPIQTYAQVEMDLLRTAVGMGLKHPVILPTFKENCQAVRKDTIVLRPDGMVHKCWDTVTDSSKAIGHISRFEEWGRTVNTTKWLNWSPLENSECELCPLLPACQGGCPHRHLFPNGSGEKMECPSWRYNLHERIFLWAEQRGLVTDGDWDMETSPTVY